MLQWRAGQLPGRTSREVELARGSWSESLQWRAGQLPGRTRGRAPLTSDAPRLYAASMEGRAIARPNQRAHRQTCYGRWQSSLQWRAGQLPGRTRKSKRRLRRSKRDCKLQWRAGQLPGRTRGRCDVHLRVVLHRCFNGGPGNCPAERELHSVRRRRVGSSSGFNGGPGNCPAEHAWSRFPSIEMSEVQASMEGRAIARPNLDERTVASIEMSASMEGRAIARPNSRAARSRASSSSTLQWRAGQLPGRTIRERGGDRRRAARFNGGPGNCPAERGPGYALRRGQSVASMEGRAIARPNWFDPDEVLAAAGLQWRAGQLPGRTHTARLAADAGLRASMEGRAIARPNISLAGLLSLVMALQWRAGQLPGRTRRPDGRG